MEEKTEDRDPPVAPDPTSEIDAMKAVADALKNLQKDAVGRVLRWAAEVHHISPQNAPQAVSQNRSVSAPTAEMATAKGPTEFDDLAEFYSAIGPSSDAEKALVVGYWIQFREGQPDLETQSVNTELKHLGYGIGNITRAFDTLTKTRPQLVIQTRKSGTSQQARKKFKLTFEGKRQVESMLANERLVE